MTPPFLKVTHSFLKEMGETMINKHFLSAVKTFPTFILFWYMCLYCSVSFGQDIPRKSRENTPRVINFNMKEWETLPIFERGRIMPLETLARVRVMSICGSEKVYVSMEGSQMDTMKLLPPQKIHELEHRLGVRLESSQENVKNLPVKRCFSASELYYAWLADPVTWEFIPFIKAENEQLRKRMKVPTHNAAGARLKYVSPDQVRRFYLSAEWTNLVNQLNDLQEKNNVNSDLIKSCENLFSAFQLYRNITFNPVTAGSARDEFTEDLAKIVQIWSEYGMMNEFQRLPHTSAPDSHPVYLFTDALRSLNARLWMHSGGDIREIPSDIKNPDDVSLETLSSLCLKMESSIHDIQKKTQKIIHDYQSQLTQHPDSIPKNKWDDVLLRQLLLQYETQKFSTLVEELKYGLYDDHAPLYILPSLNSAALNIRRDEMQRVHPWLSLNSLVYEDNAPVLNGISEDIQQKIKSAWNKTLQAWSEKDPDTFSTAMKEFSTTVRACAMRIEPSRHQLLPDEEMDYEVLQATSYPTQAQMQREVWYQKKNLFLYGWAFPALGTFLMFLSGMMGTVLKPYITESSEQNREKAQLKTSRDTALTWVLWIRWGIFTVGIISLISGLCAITLGLGMRSWIMGRAPVTNMFETIMFVALTAGVMGVWFTLRPITGPVIQDAWRRTGFHINTDPLPWLVMIIFLRLILMGVVVWIMCFADYGAETGYAAIHLTPTLALGASYPSLSDLVVWITGLMMLGVLMWWVPRLCLTPLFVLLYLPEFLNKTGGLNSLGTILYPRSWFAFAAALVTFLITYTGWYMTDVFHSDLQNLMPILRDNYWLTIHVITIVASYGAGMIAWILGVFSLLIYTLGRYDHGNPPSACTVLADLIYRAMQAAVILLVVGTILGGLWADVSWGRFWSWDRKEVWALISLLVYLAILHGRYIRILHQFSLAVGAVIGALVIIMAWYGVNYILGSTLHGYGAGNGTSLAWFLGAAGIHLILILFATIRYVTEKLRLTLKR